MTNPAPPEPPIQGLRPNPGRAEDHARGNEPQIFRAPASSGLSAGALPAYLADLTPWLSRPRDLTDRSSTLDPPPAADPYSPAYLLSVAHEALAHWNAFLTTQGNPDREAFLARARWLMDHHVNLLGGAVGWLVSAPADTPVTTAPRLSASVQGTALSVLVRAFRLTEESAILDCARRAIDTLAADILDGGVCALVGHEGVFFEDVASYPAAHAIAGHILGLLGLADYHALVNDPAVATQIQRAHATLHDLSTLFDAGYWTYDDTTHQALASPSAHALHISLIQALARHTACGTCAALGARWERYARSLWCRARALVGRATAHATTSVRLRRRRFGAPAARDGESNLIPVCVPLWAFPVPGGTRGVLGAVSQAMAGDWHIDYLVRTIGANPGGLDIEGFAGKRPTLSTYPFTWPTVWGYVHAGRCKLTRLFRQGRGYRLLLPQDALFSGAFAAAVGKLAGARVVCMDHGTLTFPYSPTYRAERLAAIRRRSWPARPALRLCLALYLRALHRLARATARGTDLYLVAGDEVAEVLRDRLGVHPSKVLPYRYAVDSGRFCPLDPEMRRQLRTRYGLSADAIVVTMINRLAPEKGLDIALAAISVALATVEPDIRANVRVLIAGEGPLRARLEADIQRTGLENECHLWGEARPEDVPLLLGVSDIFLYTGLRGTNYSVAVLEAMSSGCAVIGSVEPRSNATLLAEGRGLAVAPGEAAETGRALARLLGDQALRQQMGLAARQYVARHHSAEELRRALRRATFSTVVPRAHGAVASSTDTSPGPRESRGRGS